MTHMMPTKYFVVAGSGKNLAIAYLGFDSPSGGYPYRSAVPRDLTSNLEQAVEWLADAKENCRQLENPKIYELILQEVIVKEPPTERQKIVNEISELITPEFLQKFVKENSFTGFSGESSDEILARMIRNLVDGEK